MTDDTSRDLKGEAEPLNWACTNCGYRVEGELPEKCPECGADKEMFDEVPVPGFRKRLFRRIFCRRSRLGAEIQQKFAVP